MKKLLLFFFSLLFYVFAIPHSVYAATEFTVSNPRVVNGNFLVDLYLPNPPDNDNLCSAFITGHQVYIITSQGTRLRDFADCSSLGNGNYTVASPGIPFTGTYTIEAVGRWVEPFYDIFTSNSFDWFNPPPNFPPAIQLNDASQPTENPSVRQVAVDFGQDYTVEGSFTDTGSTSWTATVDYGDGAGSEALPLTGTHFSLLHTYNQGGTYFVTITVTDDQGAGGTLTRAVSVLDYSLTASNPRVVNGDFVIDLHGFLPDNLCSWFPAFKHNAYIVDASGNRNNDFANCQSHGNGAYTISGSPVPADGTYTIEIEEREQPPYPFTTASNAFVWTANQAPVLTPIGNKTVAEGQLLQFTITATDPDGGNLTYSAANLPPGATFDPQTATFSWTPNFNQEGNYPDIEFTVADDGSPMELDTELLTITVGNINRFPVFDLIGSKEVLENELLTFTVNATDPDGDGITLSAANLPPGASFDAQSGVFSWTPTLSQEGVYTVTFNATDNGTPVAIGSTDVVITVGDDPTPSEQADNLVDTVVEYDFPTNIENSYLANLKKVKKFIEDGKVAAAINQLQAFIEKAKEDFANGTITQAIRDDLVGLAEALLADLQ
jgi:hypothetical protein